jgi:hypothetical protein
MEAEMLTFVPWLIFLHTLSAITFFLGHGTSVAMAFRIRKETDLTRIRAMLDLSESTMIVTFVAFFIMGLSGLVMPFILKLWGKGWIWASIVLMVIVLFQMVFMNEKRYKILRKLVGLPYRQGHQILQAEAPASQAEVGAHIQKMNVTDLVVVGYVIPMIVLWLMVFKPF